MKKTFLIVTILSAISQFTFANPIVIGPTSNAEILASTFPNFSTAVHSPATAGHSLLVNTAVSCNTLTVPNTVYVHYVPGGSITVSSGSTLTEPYTLAGLYQIFYGSGTVSGVKTPLPEWWGAKADGATLSGAAINKAIASDSVGDIVQFDTGVYMIETPILVNNKIILNGKGATESESVTGSTVLRKTSTFVGDGIVVNAADATISNLVVDAVTGSTGNGITLIGTRNILRSVSTINQAQDGIRIGTDASGNNTNGWRLDQISSGHNGRYGLYIHSGDYNANAGLATGVHTANNASHGIYLNQCAANTFINPHPETNTGDGLHLAPGSNANMFFGGDFEGNSGKNIYIEAPGIGFAQFFATNVNYAYVTDLDPNTSWYNYALIKSPNLIPTAWTPTGNGVTLTVNNAWYIKDGKRVTMTFDVTWPVTANSSAATILGLPVTVGNYGYMSGTIGYTTYASWISAAAVGNSTSISIIGPVGTFLTNANLSAMRVIGSVVYFSN